MRIVDAVAHFLNCPTMRDSDCERTHWHHRIHLIPGALLRWICDRYDRSLGVTPDEMHRTGEA